MLDDDNRKGESKDFLFLFDDRWLKDTAVRSRITQRCGRWHLNVIFIDIHNPYRFLCRYIDHYASARKAHIYAELFIRSIRRDERGTLTMNEDAFDICRN